MCCRGHLVMDKVRYEMYAVGNSFLKHLLIVTSDRSLPCFQGKAKQINKSIIRKC